MGQYYVAFPPDGLAHPYAVQFGSYCRAPSMRGNRSQVTGNLTETLFPVVKRPTALRVIHNFIHKVGGQG